MSRAYRISVSGSVQRVVHVSDGVCGSLELLPILPKERTAEILAAELEQRGFKRTNGIASREEEGGVTIEVDLEKGTVTVRVASELDIDIKKDVAGHVVEERVAEGRADLQKQLDRQLEAAAQKAEEQARKEATARLEGKLRDLRGELDKITNRVTAEALKEKARSMGEIEEMVEDVENGGLTIKVKV